MTEIYHAMQRDARRAPPAFLNSAALLAAEVRDAMSIS